MTPKGGLNAEFLIRRGGGKYGLVTPKVATQKEMNTPNQQWNQTPGNPDEEEEDENQFKLNMKELVNEYFGMCNQIKNQFEQDLREAEIECLKLKQDMKSSDNTLLNLIKIKFST